MKIAFSREVRAVSLREIHIQMVIMNLRLNYVAKWEREPLGSWLGKDSGLKDGRNKEKKFVFWSEGYLHTLKSKSVM